MSESKPTDPVDVHASTFAVPGMDCPSEERLVRMALDALPDVRGLEFDLANRRLEVRHLGPAHAVLARLEPLGFGARLDGTVEVGPDAAPITSDPAAESSTLAQLLAINAVMFVVELVIGLVAQSTGLIADSLDMFADAAVYGMSLFVVGRATTAQRRAARVSGWLQAALALGALGEVARRAVHGSEPVESLMIGVALLALVANLIDACCVTFPRILRRPRCLSSEPLRSLRLPASRPSVQPTTTTAPISVSKRHLARWRLRFLAQHSCDACRPLPGERRTRSYRRRLASQFCGVDVSEVFVLVRRNVVEG